jgi:hypothetical protein
MFGKKKKRDKERYSRQLKVDFDSVDSYQDFRDLADELGVSYSQLAQLMIEHGKADIRDGGLDISQYLTDSKLPWLRDKDIDVDAYRKDRKKRGKK